MQTKASFAAEGSHSAEAHSFRYFDNQIQFTPYSTVLLVTTVVDIIFNDVRCSAGALIDFAPQATFISRRLQRKLNLSTFYAPAATRLVHNGAIMANYTKVCSVSLGSSIEHELHLETEEYVIEKLTGCLPTCCRSNQYQFVLDLKCNRS